MQTTIELQQKKYEEYKKSNQKQPIIWEAQKGGQKLFLNCPLTVWERFYGGTRGSGKTDALLIAYAQYTGLGFGPDWRGIIFRKTYPELADLVAKSKKWFYQAFPQAKWNEQKHQWLFPDGEVLLLRYMARDDDYWRYHGHEYPLIAFEELLTWATNTCYEKMKSCSRSSRAGMPRLYLSTGNPYGPGHGWVKKYFIDPAPPCTIIESEEGKRVYIPGRVEENTALLKADPAYIKKLDGIKDPNLKKAWRFNNWDIAVGGFFSDVWDVNKHVINISKRFIPPINKGFCFRSFDWGSAKPFHVGWWWESDGTEAPNGIIYPRGALILFHEWYGNIKDSDNPNIGIRLANNKIGAGILEIESKWQGLKIIPGPADPSIYTESGGPSIAAQMGDKLFVKADNSRIPGWQQMRGRMIGDPDRGPLFYIMEHCRDSIRTIPVLLRDDKNPDDIDTDMEDHPGDSARYSVMFRRYKAQVITDALGMLGW